MRSIIGTMIFMDGLISIMMFFYSDSISVYDNFIIGLAGIFNYLHLCRHNVVPFSYWFQSLSEEFLGQTLKLECQIRIHWFLLLPDLAVPCGANSAER